MVFSDELNHASIIDGCRLCRARVVVYRHADPSHLEELLATTPGRRRLVVTDTVFSMDGDKAPLRDLLEVCRRHGALLMVDEAHATGLLGATGAGAVEEEGLQGQVDLVIGTLSKALGAAGGYVAAAEPIVELLRHRARTYVFDTAPSPPSVAAARRALEIARQEPWRRERALALARVFCRELRKLGYDVLEPAAAIVPVMVGEASVAVELSARLLERGVLVPAIRPPSVPPGTARLRLTAMATLTDEQVERALDAFAAVRGQARRRSGRKEGASSQHAASGVDPRIIRAGGVFVTGTDTGVGKTVVAAAVTRALSEVGLQVAFLKAVQTGVAEGADDARFVGKAAKVPTQTGDRFSVPLAPYVAARLDGRKANVEAPLQAFAELRKVADVVVVEGAGGLLVPVTEAVTMAELAGALRLPILIVAPPRLGTLNQTALTVEAALRRGLDVLGVILCGFPARPGLAELTNPAELERLTGVHLIGVVPALEGLDMEAGLQRRLDAKRWLAPALGGTFDRTAFLHGLEKYLGVASSP